MKKTALFLLCTLLLAFTLLSTALAAEDAQPVEGQDAAPPEGEQQAGEPAAEPDAEGTLSFENLEQRVREGNLTMRSVDESMASLDAMDRQQAYDTLLEIHNAMTDMLFSYGKMGSMYATSSTQSNPLGAAYTQMDTSYSAAYLAAQQEQILNQLDSLKPEEYEKSYKEAVWQTETGRNQIIYGAQSLYITAISLERSLADGQRGLDALDRSIAEMEKRYELGQVSELTLLELKNTRTETNSSLTSLSLQIDRLKAQLSTLVGESPTQQLTLQPLPRVTQEQLDAMDFEADLETAKQNSLDLYLRQKEVADAKEAWEDAPSGYQKDMAEHDYNAIVYTKDAAIQSFELAFFNLSVSVSDNAQLLEAARSALEFAQKDYEAALVKHERGMISDNELATQQETLEAAASKVDSCADNLLSAYNNYQWALRGIVNE